MRKTMALLIFFFTLTLSVYAIDSPYIGKHSGDEFYKYLSITKQDSVVKVKYFLIFIGEKCIFNLSLILHYKSSVLYNA